MGARKFELAGFFVHKIQLMEMIWSWKSKECRRGFAESGGLYYHKKSWVENVEMFWLPSWSLESGVSSCSHSSFLQIPCIRPFMVCNLMSMRMKRNRISCRTSGRQDLLGASHYNLEAENSGKLYLVMQEGGRTFNYVTGSFPNGRFFLDPRSLRQYIFPEIGGKEHLLLVPAEFDLDELIARKVRRNSDLNLPMERVSRSWIITGIRLKLSSNPLAGG